MEKKNKDQFVIAHLTDPQHTDEVLAYSIHLAERLRKGLLLLHINDSRYPTLVTDPEAFLKDLQQSAQQQNPQIPVSYAALKGRSPEVIETLPTLLNGVVAVTAASIEAGRKSPLHTKNILKDYSNSKIAYLVVRVQQSFCPIKHVGLTVDFHRESKEKLIWSSYFSRFGASQLHVIYHDYKDDGLRQKWYNNMRFLHKFYTNLGLTFTPHIVPQKSAAVDADALPFMAESQYDLLVAVTTKEKDILDSIMGTQEQRTIRNSQNLPILFLNPRDDIYVLCD